MYALHAISLFISVVLVSAQWPQKKNGTIYVKQVDSGTVTGGGGTPTGAGTEATEKEASADDADAATPGDADDYSIVALIEIMFNDGSKKNCTGAIIHDNVVITAAHCFSMPDFDGLEPELTGSFVIIGSKNMFDSGYEQYLPIDRVVMHPNYNGWTADLALVYTFAGMMSDKPGNIIPLADGNSFTSVHSNVTVFSWNKIKKVEVKTTSTTKPSQSDSCSDSSEEEKQEHFRQGVTKGIYMSSNEETSVHGSKKIDSQSQLFIEEYMIIDLQTCKQIVQKLKPAAYQIVNVNETICYSIPKPNNIQGDSGAPSMHRNHLVSVAAGEVITDKEHIIVGMKMSCFCNWIGENLPSGGETLNCCKDCCENNDVDKVK